MVDRATRIRGCGGPVTSAPPGVGGTSRPRTSPLHAVPAPSRGTRDDPVRNARASATRALLVALLLVLTVPSTVQAGARVVLLDTGVAPGHPELADRINRDEALSLIDDGRGTRDCNGHGTAVASIIAGTRIGLAPDATITPIRVLDCRKRATPGRVIEALRHVLANRETGAWPEPTIVNASFALPRDPRIDALVDRLAGRGIPTVASAGNAGTSACGYSPANAGTSITIGAYETDRRPYWSSNTGPCVDFYAPAHRLGATPPAGYRRRTGTSISAAIATGILARAAADHLTHRQARRILDRYSIRERWGSRLTLRRP